MAKQLPRSGNAGKVKFRVFEFEMDGSDESIQDTMKTLAAALTRGGTPVRRLKLEPAGALPPGEVDVDDEPEDEIDLEVQDVVARAPNAPRKPKKVQTYDILDDIRFDQTTVDLSTFVAQYNLKSDLKKYLVVASWYKDQLKLTEINIRHWYTAFKYLKWSIPNDPAQPMRDLRAAKKLSKGTTMGHTYINHIGEKDIEPLLKNAQ